MAPTKGKQATKGQKQIVEENKSTIRFYTIIGGGATALYILLMVFLSSESFSIFYIIMTIFAAMVYFGCVQAMIYMARATYSETGQLLDGGIDLNMESGLAEHLKDLVILTALVQLLSLISNYIWLFWILAPGWAFYLLWVNFLGPWFFQPAPEVDEKKQKKLERKMRRQH